MKKELCWRHHRLYFNIVIKRIWLKLKSIQSVESWPLLCMQIKLRHAFQRFNVRTHSTQSRWVVWSKSELNQFELDWIGLNGIELDWIGLNWISGLEEKEVKRCHASRTRGCVSAASVATNPSKAKTRTLFFLGKISKSFYIFFLSIATGRRWHDSTLIWTFNK